MLATLYINTFLQNSKSCYYFTYDESAILQCDPSDKLYAEASHPRFEELPRGSTDAVQKPSPALDISNSHVFDLFLDFSKGCVDHLEPFGGRLPPLKELTLFGYDWKHSRAEYVQLWDFSRLQTLKFSRKFQDFVDRYDGVPPSHLKQLENFTISGSRDDIEDIPRVRRNLIRFLGKLKKVRKFTFETPAWQELLDIPVLAATIGKTIEEIRFLDARYRRDDDHDFRRSVSIKELSQLQSSLPKLKYLGLNLETGKNADVSAPLL